MKKCILFLSFFLMLGCFDNCVKKDTETSQDKPSAFEFTKDLLNELYKYYNHNVECDSLFRVLKRKTGRDFSSWLEVTQYLKDTLGSQHVVLLVDSGEHYASYHLIENANIAREVISDDLLKCWNIPKKYWHIWKIDTITTISFSGSVINSYEDWKISGMHSTIRGIYYPNLATMLYKSDAVLNEWGNFIIRRFHLVYGINEADTFDYRFKEIRTDRFTIPERNMAIPILAVEELFSDLTDLRCSEISYKKWYRDIMETTSMGTDYNYAGFKDIYNAILLDAVFLGHDSSRALHVMRSRFTYMLKNGARDEEVEKWHEDALDVISEEDLRKEIDEIMNEYIHSFQNIDL
jgi:hypothetical protein